MFNNSKFFKIDEINSDEIYEIKCVFEHKQGYEILRVKIQI